MSGRKPPSKPPETEALQTITEHGQEPEQAWSSAPKFVRGSTFGRYLLLQILGEGGMGVVYAAYDPELDRKVALKVLRLRRSRNADDSARLLREARALARLSHPHVVAVHDVGIVDLQPFIAMEYVEGETLASWLRKGPRTWQQMLDVFIAAGQGLAAAHAAGLIHRDFKPTNVLLGADGRIRVLDFGLARSDASADASAANPAQGKVSLGERTPEFLTALTAVGMVFGTPGYMSPEQLRGDPLDSRSDQFAYCMSFHEALGGQLIDRQLSLREQLVRIERGALPPLPESSKVPGWLRRVLQRGLSPSPEQRFPSMDALLTALQAGQRRSPWRSPGVIAAAVISALMLLGGWALGLRQNRPCAEAGARAASVWSLQARTAVQAAFIAADPLGSDAAYGEVNLALDRYLDEWSRAEIRVCELGLERRVAADELWALRSVCLERRVREVAAVVAVLSEADAATIARAKAIVDSLAPVASCDHPSALAAQLPPPDDPQARTQLDAVRTLLAQAQAALAAGRSERGLEVAKAARRRSQEIGYPPTECEALAIAGELEAQRGEPELAERALHEAVRVAELGRQDEVRARALVALVELLGANPQRRGERARWAALADAALVRAGDDPQLRARLTQAASAMADRGGER